MSRTKFEESVSVSRETLDRLERYEALIQKWNPRINLVSKGTLEEIWSRHFLDSAQLAEFSPQSGVWLDLGSGGGFPALVIAAITRDTLSDLSFILVESDTRKVAFLRTVIRELDLNASVLSDRIEDIPEQGADLVSARALGHLSALLGYAKTHLTPSGIALFPKGATHQSELDKSKEEWSFDLKVKPSITDPSAAIFAIKDIQRVTRP